MIMVPTARTPHGGRVKDLVMISVAALVLVNVFNEEQVSRQGKADEGLLYFFQEQTPGS